MSPPLSRLSQPRHPCFPNPHDTCVLSIFHFVVTDRASASTGDETRVGKYHVISPVRFGRRAVGWTQASRHVEFGVTLRRMVSPPQAWWCVVLEGRRYSVIILQESEAALLVLLASFFLAALGLHCSTQTFSSCSPRVSLAAEYRLEHAQTGVVVVTSGFSCPKACGILVA